MTFEEIKVQLENFESFIDAFIATHNEKIQSLKYNCNSTNAALEKLSRSWRRIIYRNKKTRQKFYIKDTREDIDKYIEFLNDTVNNIHSSLSKREFKLNENFTLEKLIYLLVDYKTSAERITIDENYEMSMNMHPDFPRFILGLFVKKIKSMNECQKYGKTLFFDCFNENGRIINEKVLTLQSLLNDYYKKKPTSYIGFELNQTQKEFMTTFLHEDFMKRAMVEVEEKRLKTLEERELKEKEEKEEKQKMLIEKQKRLKEKSTDISSKNNKRVKNNDPKFLLMEKYINPNTLELRTEVIDKISYDEFSKELEKMELTKSKFNKYLLDYKNLQFDKRTSLLTRILDKKDLKKIQNIIKNNSEYEDSFEQIKLFILSDNFEKLNDKDIKETFKKILEESYLISKTDIENYIVFSEKDLLKNEVESVYNAKTHEDKDAIVKSIYNQLQTLKSISIEDIKNNIENAFHELMVSSKPYVIDDKIKCYRYGARKTKVGLAVLSVAEENQKKLCEIYKTKINNNVLLIFGTGSVLLDEEDDLYDRIKKYSMDNKQKLLEIYDIFSTPFNDETFKKACELINNGFISIDSIKPIENKEKIIKKVEN